MADYRLAIGATRPSLLERLLSDGQWIDLSDALVYFRLTKHGVVYVNNVLCTVVTPTQGLVRYDWASGNLTESGTFEGRFKVVWDDATFQYFPDEPIIIEVCEP